MDWLGWSGLVGGALIALLVPVVGFWLALRQDQIRWGREKRAELYIDLLTEAHGEKEWMMAQLSRWEMQDLGADPDDDRFPPGPDTRLDSKARVILGARMAAFSTSSVRTAFNGLAAPFRVVGGPAPGASPAIRIQVEMAFDNLEKVIRQELDADLSFSWPRRTR